MAKVKVFLFGLIRNFPSVEINLNLMFEEIRNNHDVEIFLSENLENIISNQRSSEHSEPIRSGVEKLTLSGHYSSTYSIPCDLKQRILSFGDEWQDNGKSLSNIYKQFCTLNAVKRNLHDSDVYLFLRCDLDYVDWPKIVKALSRHRDHDILVPSWQGWKNGFNDRFAICYNAYAAASYTSRINRMEEFCNHSREAFHSERFLRFCLEKDKLKVGFTTAKAYRIRADGSIADERFHSRLRIICSQILRKYVS